MEAHTCRWIVSLLLIVFGIFCLTLPRGIVQDVINYKFILDSNTSQAFKRWEENPAPVYMELHFFNWSNPQDFNNQSIKPKFVEVGPYVFSEKIQKINTAFEKANNTISFDNVKYWYFDDSRSLGSLDDIITGPNFISNVFAHQTRHKDLITKLGVNLLLREHGSISKNATVREWLFEGYTDPLLKIAKEKGWTKLDKFGWYANTNGSTLIYGNIKMRRGIKGHNHNGEVLLWNGMNHTEYFQGDCGKVTGFTGEIFPLQMSTDKGVTIFSPEICRYLKLDSFEKTRHKKIDAVSFMSNKNTLPGGKCFCKPDEICKQGVAFIGDCKGNVPLYLSFPHFYSADKSLGNSVEGMRPNDIKHRFKIIIQPRVGAPLKLNSPFQLNVRYRPDESFDLYKQSRDILIPVLWMRERTEIDEHKAFFLRILLNAISFTAILGYIIFIIGCFMVLNDYRMRYLRTRSGYQRLD